MKRCLIFLLNLFLPLFCVAQDVIPTTDYSWGADGLEKAHDFCVTMMLAAVSMIYAIAGIVLIISSLRIFLKMTHGEPVAKSIVNLGLTCLFLIGATYVFPAFFGFRRL